MRPPSAPLSSAKCGIKNDPFHWLKPENWRDTVRRHHPPRSDIADFIETENSFVEAFLQDTSKLQSAIEKEIRSLQPKQNSWMLNQSAPEGYQLESNAASSYPILTCNKNGEKTVIIDFSEIAKKHKYFKLEKIFITSDSKYLIFSYDCRANETFRINIWDLNKHKPAGHYITATTGAFIVSPALNSFYYLKYNKNLRPSKLMHHKIGDHSQKQDSLILKAAKNNNFLKISSLEDNEHMIVEQDNEKENAVKFLSMKSHHFIHFKNQKKTELVKNIKLHNGYLYFRASINARYNFSLYKTKWGNFSASDWEEIIPHKPENILLDYQLTDHHIALLRMNKSGCHLNFYDGRTKQETPHPISNRAVCDIEFDRQVPGSEKISLKISSPIDMPEKTSVSYDGKKWSAPSFEKNNAKYKIERLYFKASDETDVPVTVFYAKNTPLGNGAPVFASAYGAYGLAHDMEFKPEVLSLLDRGIIFAIIHVRGGCEKGQEWHDAGKNYSKRNSCTDYLEGINFLIDQKIAQKGNVIGYGYSAGGIVAGFAANNRPDLFSTIILDMPFVDVLNTMQDKSLPLTPIEWAEWGNPIKSKKAFQYIQTYCPYQNVKKQHYPNIIALGGLYDPRVMFWEPAKLIAAIKKINEAKTKIFLYTNMEVGHWGYFSKKKSVKEHAKLYAMLLKTIGKHNDM